MHLLLTPQQQCALVDRIRAGDRSAEEELVELFFNRVALMTRTRLRGAEAARDVTQDVMLAVIRALRAGQLREAERLTGFVYGTARNLINNYVRTQARLPPEDTLDDDAVVQRVPDPLEEVERNALIRRALAVLDATSLSILTLTLVEGLKPGEIAIRLGLTPEVVRTRKSRALRQVAERAKKLSRT